ncbi:hypothetical protein [Sutcliffiella cohnii]|uniref:hypothetical protein n=1 Tax=Sutcliffiella cohnii TaxID=33932 RepID=UPI000831B522|nr:hypothetical protein [Sutcliffiella cohnii]
MAEDLIELRRKLICESEKFLRSYYKTESAFADLKIYLVSINPSSPEDLIEEVCVSEIAAYEDEIS